MMGRMSFVQFISDNYPNHIVFKCLKENTNLSDNSLLKAFKEAYRIGNEIVTDISYYTYRSHSFMELAGVMSQEALLSHSICYALLSFHSEKIRLGEYLANIRPALEIYFDDIFQHILLLTTSVAPFLPNSNTFPPKELLIPSSRKNYYDDEPCVPISVLFAYAKKLPPKDALVVYNYLLIILTDENKDWRESIKLEIQRIQAMPENQQRSKYRIANGQITNFCKIMKASCGIGIFSNAEGTVEFNVEDFIFESGLFYNTSMSKPSSLLNSAKQSNNYLDVFDDLKDEGVFYYENEEPGKPNKRRR